MAAACGAAAAAGLPGTADVLARCTRLRSAATICWLITRPLPAGSMMVIVISLGMLLRLFTVQDALSGFSNVTVWLIVAAFLFARGFVQTRLGERIAYTIVRRVGRSPLRLGYSLALADLAMAPMTPSNTARAGGI